LARFSTGDEAVAVVDPAGLVESKGPGDTHIVAFYDSGIGTVPVMLPSSDRLGERYPDVPAPTRIDELVQAKLRQCGIVPSELCTDQEFLRRLSLDLTGSLPRPEEVETFLVAQSADKRARKIDELLARPTYAEWWTTRLCDLTGNNGQYREGIFAAEFTRQWYAWIYRRVLANTGYDEIVKGIVLGNSRQPGQTFAQFNEEMSSYFHKDKPADFALRSSMPYFWIRRTIDRPENKALAFSHAFLGLRLQCAQCHKHPFDQWTQQDFNQFAGFFQPIVYGTPVEDRDAFATLEKSLMAKPADGKGVPVFDPAIVRKGTMIPWREVFLSWPTPPVPKTKAPAPAKDSAKLAGPVKAARPAAPAARAKPPAPVRIKAKLLGGEIVEMQKGSDPRQILLDWMLGPNNPYFARAFVNRVWAGYFNAGIIDPVDDLNAANPPSNKPLLDYLTEGFIAHRYDMKWLHREIANSRTYQLSWKPNETNRLDRRNFSHALPRRIPAEVAYDALAQATASSEEMRAWDTDLMQRVIGLGASPFGKKARAGYALTVFGKPDRLTNCDCERSNEASLLQTLFLLNDGDVTAWLDHKEGWVSQVGKQFKDAAEEARRKAAQVAAGQAERSARERAIANLEKRVREAAAAGQASDAASLQKVLAALGRQLNGEKTRASSEPARTAPSEARLIREAYLRTVSRLPTDQESERARRYFKETGDPVAGLRDLLWALLNTNEFIVNH
jgi:hypothetical protein